MGIEWDDAKDQINQQKHGLSFAEVRGLFEPGAEFLEIFDREHSDFEDRFIAIGPVDRGLVVDVYMVREEENVRIIGARMANKREQSLYRSYMDQNR